MSRLWIICAIVAVVGLGYGVVSLRHHTENLPRNVATTASVVSCDADQDDSNDIMKASSPGSTITLENCTYYLKTTLVLDNGVTLQGVSRAGSIIRPVNSQGIDCIDRKSASGGEEINLTIRTLTMTQCDRTVYLGDGGVFSQVTSTDNNVGAYIGGYSAGTDAQSYGDDVQITNSRFVSNDEFGVFGKLKDSTFSSARPVVGNNILTGNGEGGSADCGTNTDPQNCAQTKFITTPPNPSDGGPLVCGNKVSNSVGPNTDGNGIWFDVVKDQHYDTGAFIQGNTIWGNDGDGVRIEVTDDVTVGGTGTVDCAGKTLDEGNVIYNNQSKAIQIINADNATVIGNSLNCLGATGPGVPVQITYNARTQPFGSLFSVTNNHVTDNSIFVRSMDLLGYNNQASAGTSLWSGNQFSGNNYWVDDSSGSAHWKCSVIGDCGDNSTSSLTKLTQVQWQARGEDTSGSGAIFRYGNLSACG